MATLTCLGAIGTVTGSRHLLEVDGRRFLVDCGLFQGTKDNRLRNWAPPPFDPASIDGVFLTHAHIDHIGALPRLVKDGYSGPVWCTHATAELAGYLLPDSARLQEEEAAFANKRGYTRHRPALPLYDEADAERALRLLRPVHYGEHVLPLPGLRAQYRDAGHLLGSAMLDIKVTRDGRSRKIVFGGDLGRPRDPLLHDPSSMYNVDYLVLESTYGDRLHGAGDPVAALAEAVHASLARGGVLVIPTFAVGRAQLLLHVLRELEDAGSIPALPVFLDSPMAVGTVGVFERRIADLNLAARRLAVRGTRLFRPRHLHLTESRQQSQAINAIESRAIILSASGMCTGGRILHHLAQRLPDPRHTVLFVGYQGEGTRGRALLDGKPEVKIHGAYVPVRAHITSIPGFSGHADYEEILAWLLGFPKPPEATFLVHGEPAAREALAGHIRRHNGGPVVLPEEGRALPLDL